MANKQWQIIAISCIVALFVLFGGWRFSSWLTLQKPIEEVLQTGQSFHFTKEVDIQPEVVKIHLEIIDAEKFIQQYPEIQQKLQKIVGEKKLEVSWDNKSNMLTKDAWEGSRFGVQEAIAHKNYGEIPTVAEEHAKEQGVDSLTRIDEDYLYLAFVDGQRFTVEMVPIQLEVK